IFAPVHFCAGVGFAAAGRLAPSTNAIGTLGDLDGPSSCRPARAGWHSSQPLSSNASGEVQVGAGEDLVHLEHVRSREHLGRGSNAVCLGNVCTLPPGHEVVDPPPPSHPLEVALALGNVDPSAGLVVEAHRARAMHLVADEARVAVDQVNPLAKAILEIDLVTA